jgi:hypothetical protein
MELFVAGIIHYDPLGRRRLRQWLSELLSQHNEPPSFVAVEWDSGHFGKIVAQRSRLADLVRAHWTAATEEFIQGLADAAGYEGDSHIPLLSDVETVWLDEGRVVREEDIEEFAELRFAKYRALAKGLDRFDAKALEYMSNIAWKAAEPRNEDPDPRDDIFAGRLFAKLNNRCGIAIMGVNHTTDSPPGSAVDLLMHSGITCHVTKITPYNNSA